MKNYSQYYIEPRRGEGHVSLDGIWDYAFTDDVSELSAIEWKYETAIPSSTYRSLYRSGILPDPYVGTNCKLYNWVDEKVWYYRKKFSVDAKGRKAFLVFDGVSYYARFWLNGELLGEHDGMFGGPVFEVSKYLRDGENELVAEVKAPNWGEKATWKTFNRDGSQKAIVPWNLARDNDTSNGEFISFGIWREVRLELVEPCHISRPYLTTTGIGDSLAKLHLSMEIIPDALDELSCVNPDYIDKNQYLYAAGGGLNLEPIGKKVDVRIKFTDPDGKVCLDETSGFDLYDRVGYDRRFPEANYFERELEITDPRLWNPVGLGNPDLYKVEIELYHGGKLLDRLDFDFGIRTFSRDFTKGAKFVSRFQKFLFSVNGKEFFLRGMNWMPTDFLLDCTEEDYRWALEAIRDAGIQFIRIWSGGGVPESDIFYSLCDRYGIMVWQDHAIANMITPNWDRLALEAMEGFNLYRIRNHASLVMHCGGNEFNAYALGNAASMYIIERSIRDLDPTREYVRTTPDGGSAHIYRDMEPVWYRKAYKDLPFIAESGIHCFPSAATLRTLISEDEAKASLSEIFSDSFKTSHPELVCHFTEFRADRIPRMLSRASHILDIRSMNLPDICEATQMASFEFYQIMIESMRENYPVCGGIMPWVFKRAWPTTAIQVMDGQGEALAPYYAVSNAYSDIAVSLRLTELVYAPGERVSLSPMVVNAKDSAALCGVRVRVFSPELETLLDESASVTADPGGYPARLPEYYFTIPESFADKQFFVYVTCAVDGEIVNRKFYSLSCLSWMADEEKRSKHRAAAVPNLNFENGPWLRDEWRSAPKAKLSVSVAESSYDGMFVYGKVRISNDSDYPAYPVHFTTNRDEVKTCLDDSYFLLDAREERTIGFRLKNTGGKPCKLIITAWNADDTEAIV